MKAYTAQVIYRIICKGVLTEQYEEQWRLVFAEDEREALEAARELATEEQCTFIDRRGRPVEWQLVAVKDLCEVELRHGAMLFSSVKEIEPIAAPLWELSGQN